MSYRPEEQSICGPLEDIMKGIDKFSAAVNERIKDGDWTEEHLEEINDLRGELLSLYARIGKLARDNW